MPVSNQRNTENGDSSDCATANISLQRGRSLGETTIPKLCSSSACVSKLPSNDMTKLVASTRLYEVLSSLGLIEYLANLVGHGFHTWSRLLEITEEDLEQLNVKLGHRRKLQREIGITKNIKRMQLEVEATTDVPIKHKRKNENDHGGFRKSSLPDSEEFDVMDFATFMSDPKRLEPEEMRSSLDWRVAELEPTLLEPDLNVFAPTKLATESSDLFCGLRLEEPDSFSRLLDPDMTFDQHTNHVQPWPSLYRRISSTALEPPQSCTEATASAFDLSGLLDLSLLTKTWEPTTPSSVYSSPSSIFKASPSADSAYDGHIYTRSDSEAEHIYDPLRPITGGLERPGMQKRCSSSQSLRTSHHVLDFTRHKKVQVPCSSPASSHSEPIESRATRDSMQTMGAIVAIRTMGTKQLQFGKQQTETKSLPTSIYVQPLFSPCIITDTLYRTLYLREKTLEAFVYNLAMKCNVLSSQIIRVVRTDEQGLETFVDDTAICSLVDDQAMVAFFEEVNSPLLTMDQLLLGQVGDRKASGFYGVRLVY